MIKQFKVATVSKNTNSFGLHGMILMALDGEAWEVAANSINKKPAGTILNINPNSFASLGFEIPHQLPNAPDSVVNEVWGN